MGRSEAARAQARSMNDSHHTLQLLLERAEAERDAVRARALRAAEAARRLAAQAEQLLAYRDEYRRRAPALGARAAAIELLRCHRDFMARLEQAIAQQRVQREVAERDAAVLHEALLVQETRVAAVRKLIERRALESRRHAARAEQRRTDEDAMRARWALRAASPSH
jgi:flagellar FliJ protein